MKWIKRSFLYVRRNSKRMFQLFLILFILGNTMCIVSSISTSSKTLANLIKQKIGSIIIYKDSRYNNSITIENESDLNYLMEYENILNQMILHDSVKYGNYSYMMELNDQSESVYYGYGISHSPMVDILENKIEIVEGREFTQEEITKGENVVLVSEGTIHNGKEIQLNDEVSMSLVNTIIKCNEESGCELLKENIEYSLKVIGIFRKVERVFDYQNKGFDDISKRWYLPNLAIRKLFSEQLEMVIGKELLNDLTLGIDEPFIRLKDSQDLKQYLKEIRPLLANELNDQGDAYDTLYTSDDEYQIISKPIQFIENIGRILLVGSGIVFSVLLCILLISVIKERIYEIGILLALGESKYKVIIQLFTELMIIGTLSISCSFVTGNILSNITYNYLVTDEMLEEVEIEEIDIDKQEYIVLVYEFSFVIIILSLIYPSIVINKQNPKEILLK